MNIKNNQLVQRQLQNFLSYTKEHESFNWVVPEGKCRKGIEREGKNQFPTWFEHNNRGGILL